MAFRVPDAVLLITTADPAARLILTRVAALGSLVVPEILPDLALSLSLSFPLLLLLFFALNLYILS
eukprot:Gb_31265 [translate_table: standard]